MTIGILHDKIILLEIILIRDKEDFYLSFY